MAALDMRERYPVSMPHTHDALDDAREQAAIVREILATAWDHEPSLRHGREPT